MNIFFFLAQEVAGPEELNFGMLFLRMLVFLVLVLVLIYFVLRKMLPLFIQGRRPENRTVKILERIPLDQKKSLLVVQVLDKIYLLGSAEGQINVLMELEREKVISQIPAAEKTVSFKEILNRTFSKPKSSGNPTSHEL